METKQQQTFELLKMYGSRWAILTAMSMDMVKKGIQLPDDIFKNLEVARIEIKSGCYSTCEIDSTLSKVERAMISKGYVLGEGYLDHFYYLLGRSMQGIIDYEELIRIPAVKPIENACDFLNCKN
ncbi:hypothetical protein ACFLS7_01520 [Bacteroidota bacterium]